MRNVGLCPTTSGFGFGSSLGFDVETPRVLRCILLFEDSTALHYYSITLDVDHSGTVARRGVKRGTMI